VDPELEIRLSEKNLYVEGSLNGKYAAAELFPVLKKIFKRYQARNRNDRPFFTGGFVGYFGYETADLCDKIKFREKPGPDVPRACLGLFRDLIVYDHQKRVYHLVCGASQTRDRKERLKKLKSYFEKTQTKFTQHFEFKKFTDEMPQDRFKGMVEKAKEYIAAGDIYQANLSQRFSFKCRGSSLELYGKLRTINPSPFSCFLKTGDLEIVSSSPERLVRKKGRLCETRPIAGTCPVRGSSGRLARWRKQLLQNEKERAEHLMLVDLERNDLGRVCDYRSVKVEEFMTLEKYSHVVHIVSRITGKLKKRKDALDVIKALFPGGTITGCPKIRCMQIIDELEPMRRGVYTGSLGYIDLYGDMDLNIVIRTMILRKGMGHLQVGAGIVYDSDPEKEYKETLHKAQALIQALREASTGHDEL
jgi:para-aminobenzoate synthetase component 1